MVRYEAKFDHTPKERAEPRSAGLTIALMNPVFADIQENAFRYEAPYSTFIKNMGNDFEELMTAKGFSIRGPFVNRDEMVYGDKKNSDLAFHIEVDIEEEGGLHPTRYGGYSQYATPYYKVSGTYYTNATLNMLVTDPMNGEKFWKKSITLPRKEITCRGVKKFYKYPPSSSEVLTDVAVYNAVAKALDEYYDEALSSASRHIDSEEFKKIAEEIEKSRK